MRSAAPYRRPLRDRVAALVGRLSVWIATPCEHDWMSFSEHRECFLCGKYENAGKGSDQVECVKCGSTGPDGWCEWCKAPVTKGST